MTIKMAAGNVPQIIRILLRAAVALSLLFYAWIMLDLVTHPFSPGNNPGTVPFLFRWLSAAAGTFTLVVAVFILRRVPANINGPLLVLWGVGAAGWSLRMDFGSPTVTGAVQVVFGFYFFCMSFPALVGLIFHFPTGEVFPPRLSGRVWVLLAVGAFAGFLSALSSPSIDPSLPNPVYVSAFSPFFFALNVIIVVILPSLALISLGLRYRGGGTMERLQIKWLLWLVSLGLALTIALTTFFPASISGEPDSSATQLANIVGYIYWQVFPAAAIGIALLRHRLWDIDLIIRRTLIYGVLSGALALIYFGGVTLLQQIFAVITGQQSPASIVITTLLIAALFLPLRQGVQSFIDRRFYRQRYDADLSMAQFGASLRERVEVDAVTIHLVSTVDSALSPEQISLWLRKDR